MCEIDLDRAMYGGEIFLKARHEQGQECLAEVRWLLGRGESFSKRVFMHRRQTGRGIPGQEEIKKSSSWGVLRHELHKKTRHKRVREMLEAIPDVITSLAPCLR